MSGAIGMAGQNTEYTVKKTIQSAMLPQTARWENYDTNKGRQEQKGRLQRQDEVK